MDREQYKGLLKALY